MPSRVRGTWRFPITRTCHMWRSRSSPGRVHSTPHPVHVAAPDVVARRAPGRLEDRGVTVFCGASEVVAGALVAGAETAPLAADALVVSTGGALGCDPDGEPIHVGCEPEGLPAGCGLATGAGSGLTVGGACFAACFCAFAGCGL